MPNKSKFIETKNSLGYSSNMSHGRIYIFNGHRLSLSYFYKLKNARDEAKLECGEIFCLSGDPTDQAHRDLSAQNLISASPSQFLLDCALGLRSFDHADSIIPDHTAKHILLMAYMDITREILPEAHVELAPLELNLTTPFMHKSDNNAIWAMSHATWMCPPDCDEPAVCPHIQNSRTWDFFDSLEKVLKKTRDLNAANPENLVYHYGCTPIFAEIAHIPLKTIVDDLKDYVQKLKNGVRQPVVVATHSHCHAIVGRFTP